MPTSDGSETSPATVTWSTQAGDELCGALVGEVDAFNRDAVLAEVTARVGAHGGASVQFDLGALTFCDARTLVALARLVDDARAAGVAAELVSVPPHLARILTLVTGDPQRIDPASG